MKKLIVLVLVLAVAGIANGALIANFPCNESSGTVMPDTVVTDGTTDGAVVGGDSSTWVNIGSRYVLNANMPGSYAASPPATVVGTETTDKVSINYWSKNTALTAGSIMMDSGAFEINKPFSASVLAPLWNHSMSPYLYTVVPSTDLTSWHMWTYTKDGATGAVEILFDGSSIASNTNGSAAITGTGWFYFWKQAGEFQGLLAEIQIWDSVMTAGEITAAYDAGVASGIPEPMTIALLGLGGLFLRRRK